MGVLASGGVRSLAALFLRDERRRGRRVKHLQVFGVVIGHRRERYIHVFESFWIFLDPLVDAADAAIQNGEARKFHGRFNPVTRVEYPDGLARQAGPAVTPEF